MKAAGSCEGETRAAVKHRPSDAWTRPSGNDHLTNPPGCGKKEVCRSASGKYPQRSPPNSSFPWKQPRWSTKYSPTSKCISLFVLLIVTMFMCHSAQTHWVRNELWCHLVLWYWFGSFKGLICTLNELYPVLPAITSLASFVLFNISFTFCH